MIPAKLKALLASGNLTGNRLADATRLCHDWYMAEPSVVTFTLCSLFTDLMARGWDDGQGVSSAQYCAFPGYRASRPPGRHQHLGRHAGRHTHHRAG